MAQRVRRRVVALSTMAVAAVYSAGYLRTAPAAARIAAAEQAFASGGGGSSAVRSGVLLLPAAPTAAPALPEPTGPFNDGTYTGYGTSRRGDVEVAVVVNDGQIVSAEITRCMTQYPQSRIAGLPAQVVARQSVLVDAVTGATYSMRAYQDAVRAALTRAQQA